MCFFNIDFHFSFGLLQGQVAEHTKNSFCAWQFPKPDTQLSSFPLLMPKLCEAFTRKAGWQHQILFHMIHIEFDRLPAAFACGFLFNTLYLLKMGILSLGCVCINL